MNKLPFTDEHKAKLIEMCKTLFDCDEVNVKNVGVVYMFLTKNNVAISDPMCWMEFIVVYLSSKVFNSTIAAHSKFTAAQFRGHILACVQDQHPIDALYYYFKKE